MEFHSCTENSQWNSSSLQPFSSDTRVSCSSPTLLIPSTSSSSSSTISSPSSSSMKYYGNSMDFVEDFFVNYLKYDYTQVPTFNYLKSMMTNIREMGSSDLIFDFDSDLSKLIYETSSSNHNNMNSHSENRHHDSTITTTTHNDEVERKNSSLTFLDFHDLELFMDDLSISMQEQQEEFHLQEQECETNAVDNPFVALEILKAAFEIQYLEENDDHDGEGSVDF
nr:unnamed protein product [Naegleria fowleri]